MLIFAIIAALGGLVTSAASIYCIFRFLSVFRSAEARFYSTITDSLSSFVTSPSPDQPSPLAVVADQIAIILAGRIMQQLRASMAGVASGQAREELDLAEAAVTGQSPLLGLLAGIVPKKYRNKILRNPQMVGQLVSLAGGNGHNPAPGGAGPVQRSFSL